MLAFRLGTQRLGTWRRQNRTQRSMRIESLEQKYLLAADALPQTFVVDTTADTVDLNPGDGIAVDVNGDTSLRAAVMEANALPGIDTIELPEGTFQFTLAGRGENLAALGDLDVNDDLVIVGASQLTSIIDAAGLDRVFEVSDIASLTLRDLTITGGQALEAPDDFGAGVLGHGPLEIERVEMHANRAENGGAIAAGDTLVVRNAYFHDNRAENTGGAIRALGLTEIRDSRFSTAAILGTNSGLFRK